MAGDRLVEAGCRPHMQDTIHIEDLEVFYRVGVPDQERARPQRLLVTVEVECDFRPAVAKDDLALTIDYHQISRRLLTFGEGREWKLIETLAVEIAELIVREFRAERVRVEVKKFVVPEARHVSVRTERMK